MSTRVMKSAFSRAFAVLALVAVFSSPAFASMAMPTGQKRTLLTHAEASSDGVAPMVDDDAASAGNFDPFGTTIDSHALVGPPVPADAYGQATQLSSFLPSQIHCEGASHASILTHYYFLPEGARQSYADSSAASTCEFAFVVDEATDWKLSGLLTSSFSGSTADLVLRIDGGATLFTAAADYDNNVESMPFDVTQTLLPGNTYKLTFTSSSTASGVGGETEEDFNIDTMGSYSGQLALVPEPTTLALLALLIPFQARRRR